MNWKDKVKQELPYMGHRNWLLVVDKAYPLQSAEGMRYTNTNMPLPEVLDFVLSAMKDSPHVKPIIYTDQELNALDDTFCKGIGEMRDAINQVIARHADKSSVRTMLHDDVFNKLDAASKLFTVQVLKTESLLPYTSVFIEFDCGYWSETQEKKLREKMK